NGVKKRSAWGDIEDPTNPGRGCTVDGVQTSCEKAFRMINRGQAEICPNNDCGVQTLIGSDGSRSLGILGSNRNTGELGYFTTTRGAGNVVMGHFGDNNGVVPEEGGSGSVFRDWVRVKRNGLFFGFGLQQSGGPIPPKPQPAPTPYSTPHPPGPLRDNPCKNASATNLDYSVTRQYGKGSKAVTENAEQHIMRRHGSGPNVVGPTGPQLNDVSYYITSPPVTGKDMFAHIKALNVATFNRPTQVIKQANGDYHFIKDFPPITVLPLPFSPTRSFIGFDRTTNGYTERNNLFVSSDCKTVQTSYPGT
ncbi:MAG: hypothetical protein ACREA2_00590, partial [Blastocatellia bacterium]